MKNPFIYLLGFCLIFSITLQAQKISPSDFKLLHQKEDSLKRLAKNLYVDSLTAQRMRSDSTFIRTLVRSLQIKNSFYYPFDSVQGISKLYAPDSTFRIFTWSLAIDDYYTRQRGAIQYRTPDGSLKLTPLRDFSEFTPKPLDSVRTKDNWIGAVYYKIIKTQYNGKNYYTLFGYDANSVRSNKKWIEVLHFNDRNQPIFGGPLFSFANDSTKRETQYRYDLEYKKEASTVIQYDPDLNMIIFDHLIPENDDYADKTTYIPDGDYEGFKWQGGKWVHVDKVFDYKLKDGEFPVPDPIRDAQGNNNEQKLKEQSEKNKIKKGNH